MTKMTAKLADNQGNLRRETNQSVKEGDEYEK